MACCNNTNCVILRTLKSIDQRQKEAVISSGCITCESSLLSSVYNTIPVTLFLCNGEPFNAFLDSTNDETTRLFRVEDVIDDEVVKLRLIEVIDNEVGQDVRICTNQTCLCNIGCICCLECFSPMICEACGLPQ